MAGKRSNFPRNDRDWYGTPIKAVYPVAPFLKDKNYISPFAGDGRLIEHIRMLQPTASCVAAFDMEPQVDEVIGVKISPVDFNSTDVEFWHNLADADGADCFVDNPPWVNTKESGYLLNRIIETLSSVRPTWLLMNGSYIFNKRSSRYMRMCTDVVPIGRVKWIEDSPHSGKEDCIWARFDNRKNETQLTYIHPRESYNE